MEMLRQELGGHAIQLVTYVALLGVYLVVLGIALAGLCTAIRRQKTGHRE
jgi:hypothetical protein